MAKNNIVSVKGPFIPQAHMDDIHGLVQLADRTGKFVSGSKDGTVKIWSDGRLLKDALEGNSSSRFSLFLKN